MSTNKMLVDMHKMEVQPKEIKTSITDGKEFEKLQDIPINGAQQEFLSGIRATEGC